MKKRQKKLKAENIIIDDIVAEDVLEDAVTDSPLEEVTVNRKKRGKRFILLYVAIGVFAAYAVFSLVSQHSKIESRQAELDALNEKISVQELKNDEINNIYNLSDEDNKNYIEEKAKEDGYLHRGERVFVNISGD